MQNRSHLTIEKRVLQSELKYSHITHYTSALNQKKNLPKQDINMEFNLSKKSKLTSTASNLTQDRKDLILLGDSRSGDVKVRAKSSKVENLSGLSDRERRKVDSELAKPFTSSEEGNQDVSNSASVFLKLKTESLPSRKVPFDIDYVSKTNGAKNKFMNEQTPRHVVFSQSRHKKVPLMIDNQLSPQGRKVFTLQTLPASDLD